MAWSPRWSSCVERPDTRGPRGGDGRTLGLSPFPVPGLPRDRARLAAGHGAWRPIDAKPRRCDPHRHRRPAGRRGARPIACATGWRSRPRSTPASRRFWRRRCTCPSAGATRGSGASTPARQPRDGADRRHARDPARHGFENLRPWSHGVDLDLFEPLRRCRDRPAAAGVPVRRPRLVREEPRGVPEARPAGLEARLRCRAAAGTAAARTPAGALARRRAAQRTGARLQQRRRVRVSRAAAKPSAW